MAEAPEATAKSSSEPFPGQRIDRYQVLEKIGEGGMGSVYRVQHVMLQKQMAMKLLRFELSQNQELVTRFQNEAIAASRIGQENIVAVTDFGRTSEGLVYFVMEELLGLSLAVAIRQEVFSAERTVTIAAQCCRALHAAHAAGIIHRDLKPENIVLTSREGVSDFVKVLDFGISKMNELGMGSEEARLTRAGMIVGTPEYMAPEQGAGGVVDARSDIYALGIVLFEMLSGKLPFEAENPLQMLLAHQSREVPPLAKVKPGLKVSPKLERVIRRALSKQPGERQQSMAELLSELQACTDAKEITQPGLRLRLAPVSSPNATPAPASTRVSLAPTVTTPVAASELGEAEALDPVVGSRSRVMWWGVAAGVLILCGVALAWKGRGPDQTNAAGESRPPVVAASPAQTAPPLDPLPTLPAPPAPSPAPAPVNPPVAPRVAEAPRPERPVKPATRSEGSHAQIGRRATQSSSARAPAAAPAQRPSETYEKMDELKQAYPSP